MTRKSHIPYPESKALGKSVRTSGVFLCRKREGPSCPLYNADSQWFIAGSVMANQIFKSLDLGGKPQRRCNLPCVSQGERRKSANYTNLKIHSTHGKWNIGRVSQMKQFQWRQYLITVSPDLERRSPARSKGFRPGSDSSVDSLVWFISSQWCCNNYADDVAEHGKRRNITPSSGPVKQKDATKENFCVEISTRSSSVPRSLMPIQEQPTRGGITPGWTSRLSVIERNEAMNSTPRCLGWKRKDSKWILRFIVRRRFIFHTALDSFETS